MAPIIPRTDGQENDHDQLDLYVDPKCDNCIDSQMENTDPLEFFEDGVDSNNFCISNDSEKTVMLPPNNQYETRTSFLGILSSVDTSEQGPNSPLYETAQQTSASLEESRFLIRQDKTSTSLHSNSNDCDQSVDPFTFIMSALQYQNHSLASNNNSSHTLEKYPSSKVPSDPREQIFAQSKASEIKDRLLQFLLYELLSPSLTPPTSTNSAQHPPPAHPPTPPPSSFGPVASINSKSSISDEATQIFQSEKVNDTAKNKENDNSSADSAKGKSNNYFQREGESSASKNEIVPTVEDIVTNETSGEVKESPTIENRKNLNQRPIEKRLFSEAELQESTAAPRPNPVDTNVKQKESEIINSIPLMTSISKSFKSPIQNMSTDGKEFLRYTCSSNYEEACVYNPEIPLGTKLQPTESNSLKLKRLNYELVQDEERTTAKSAEVIGEPCNIFCNIRRDQAECISRLEVGEHVKIPKPTGNVKNKCEKAQSKIVQKNIGAFMGEKTSSETINNILLPIRNGDRTTASLKVEDKRTKSTKNVNNTKVDFGKTVGIVDAASSVFNKEKMIMTTKSGKEDLYLAVRTHIKSSDLVENEENAASSATEIKRNKNTFDVYEGFPKNPTGNAKQENFTYKPKNKEGKGKSVRKMKNTSKEARSINSDISFISKEGATNVSIKSSNKKQKTSTKCDHFPSELILPRNVKPSKSMSGKKKIQNSEVGSKGIINKLIDETPETFQKREKIGDDVSEDKTQNSKGSKMYHSKKIDTSTEINNENLGTTRAEPFHSKEKRNSNSMKTYVSDSLKVSSRLIRENVKARDFETTKNGKKIDFSNDTISGSAYINDSEFSSIESNKNGSVSTDSQFRNKGKTKYVVNDHYISDQKQNDPESPSMFTPIRSKCKNIKIVHDLDRAPKKLPAEMTFEDGSPINEVLKTLHSERTALLKSEKVFLAKKPKKNLKGSKTLNAINSSKFNLLRSSDTQDDLVAKKTRKHQYNEVDANHCTPANSVKKLKVDESFPSQVDKVPAIQKFHKISSKPVKSQVAASTSTEKVRKSIDTSTPSQGDKTSVEQNFHNIRNKPVESKRDKSIYNNSKHDLAFNKIESNIDPKRSKKQTKRRCNCCNRDDNDLNIGKKSTKKIKCRPPPSEHIKTINIYEQSIVPVLKPSVESVVEEKGSFLGNIQRQSKKSASFIDNAASYGGEQLVSRQLGKHSDRSMISDSYGSAYSGIETPTQVTLKKCIVASERVPISTLSERDRFYLNECKSKIKKKQSRARMTVKRSRLIFSDSDSDDELPKISASVSSSVIDFDTEEVGKISKPPSKRRVFIEDSDCVLTADGNQLEPIQKCCASKTNSDSDSTANNTQTQTPQLNGHSRKLSSNSDETSKTLQYETPLQCLMSELSTDSNETSVSVCETRVEQKRRNSEALKGSKEKDSTISKQKNLKSLKGSDKKERKVKDEVKKTVEEKIRKNNRKLKKESCRLSKLLSQNKKYPDIMKVSENIEETTIISDRNSNTIPGIDRPKEIAHKPVLKRLRNRIIPLESLNIESDVKSSLNPKLKMQKMNSVKKKRSSPSIIKANVNSTPKEDYSIPSHSLEGGKKNTSLGMKYLASVDTDVADGSSGEIRKSDVGSENSRVKILDTFHEKLDPQEKPSISETNSSRQEEIARAQNSAEVAFKVGNTPFKVLLSLVLKQEKDVRMNYSCIDDGISSKDASAVPVVRKKIKIKVSRSSKETASNGLPPVAIMEKDAIMNVPRASEDTSIKGLSSSPETETYAKINVSCIVENISSKDSQSGALEVNNSVQKFSSLCEETSSKDLFSGAEGNDEAKTIARDIREDISVGDSLLAPVEGKKDAKNCNNIESRNELVNEVKTSMNGFTFESMSKPLLTERKNWRFDKKRKIRLQRMALKRQRLGKLMKKIMDRNTVLKFILEHYKRKGGKRNLMLEKKP